jgi:hypothetical protein
MHGGDVALDIVDSLLTRLPFDRRGDPLLESRIARASGSLVE